MGGWGANCNGFCGFHTINKFQSYSLEFDLNYEQTAVQIWPALVVRIPQITAVTFALMSD